MSAADHSKPKSFGLIGMRERAYILGGDFAVESERAPAPPSESRFRLEDAT
jgi:signal transduction histidine kinase